MFLWWDRPGGRGSSKVLQWAVPGTALGLENQGEEQTPDALHSGGILCFAGTKDRVLGWHPEALEVCTAWDVASQGEPCLHPCPFPGGKHPGGSCPLSLGFSVQGQGCFNLLQGTQ